jgi:hypothetical protein
LQVGIKGQRQDWQPLVQNITEVDVVAGIKARSSFVDIQRLGLFSEIDYVVELRAHGHLWRTGPIWLNNTSDGWRCHSWSVRLLVANLLVSDKVLKMDD